MKHNLFHNNTFMAVLSIIIIVAIVLIATNGVDTQEQIDDSTGKAYSVYGASEDVFDYQKSWSEHPITRNNRPQELPDIYD